jgi:hypothetical protein
MPALTLRLTDVKTELSSCWPAIRVEKSDFEFVDFHHSRLRIQGVQSFGPTWDVRGCLVQRGLEVISIGECLEHLPQGGDLVARLHNIDEKKFVLC